MRPRTQSKESDSPGTLADLSCAEYIPHGNARRAKKARFVFGFQAANLLIEPESPASDFYSPGWESLPRSIRRALAIWFYRKGGKPKTSTSRSFPLSGTQSALQRIKRLQRRMKKCSSPLCRRNLSALTAKLPARTNQLAPDTHPPPSPGTIPRNHLSR